MTQELRMPLPPRSNGFRGGSFLLLLWLLLITSPASVLQAQSPAQIESAVTRGLAALRSGEITDRSMAGLITYTLLTGGDAADSPRVQQGLNLILAKFNATNSTYKPLSHHLYEAGIDAMALEKLDAQGYQPQLQAIVDYIVSEQRPHGGWFYPGQGDNLGDTSITQYAVLGLWAASRGGVTVPQATLAQAAEWHLKMQVPDGGFSYHPSGNAAARNSTGTMTVAGSGSLGILNLLLFGDTAVEQGKAEPRLKFGILEKVNPTEPARNPAAVRHLRPLIQKAVQQAYTWVNERFDRDTRSDHGGFQYYYYYALERTAVVNRWSQLNNKDWYQHGAQILLSQQGANGHWTEANNRHTYGTSSTCFALLFLMRATNKHLTRPEAAPPLGQGVLAGGRGLPDDLSQVEFRNGKVQTENNLGAFDQLLSGLSQVTVEQSESLAQPIESTQVDMTTPQKLIDQPDRLPALLKHQDPRVRQLAVWAAGRTESMSLVSQMLPLLQDNDIAVAVEAHQALCWLARKPQGWGHLPDPRTEINAETPAETATTLINTWKTAVSKDWNSWHLQNRPYELRDDFNDPFQQTLRKSSPRPGR